MEKRTVRIYKSPDGKGKYINKTNQFLHRAQEGAQVDNGMDQYVQYIQSELQNQTAPEEIYNNLVKAGLPEEDAQSLIQQIMQGMSQPQENEAAEYQDGGESQAISQYDEMNDQTEEEEEPETLASLIEETPGTQNIKFPGLAEYMPNYEPIGWEASNIDSEGQPTFAKGGTKKSFAKNVLSYLKKQQEGGDSAPEEQDPNRPLGRGTLQDTSTDTVSKRKSNFLATLKNQADQAKTEEVYEKLMQSGDPSFMKIADTLGQGEKAKPLGLPPIAQTGGFTGGEDPMTYFQDGGYDEQYAQEGKEVRKAKINYVPRRVTVDRGLGELLPWNKLISSKKQFSQTNPYHLADHKAYTGSMEGYEPIERRVTKSGIFGRPKEWTDVYSKKGTSAPKTPGQEIKAAYEKQIADARTKDTGDKYGMSEELWDSLPGKAKRDIRKGERRLNRELERGIKQNAEEVEFNKGVHKFTDLGEQERKQNQARISKGNERLKEVSTEMGMDNPEWWANATRKEEEALPYGLTLEDLEMLNTEQVSAEKNQMNPFYDKQNEAAAKLKKFYDSEKDYAQNESDIKNAANLQFSKIKSFRPDKNLAAMYEQKRKQQEETQSLNEQMRQAEYEKKLGGWLNKYQIAGGVKSPTNKLSPNSDATANTGDLSGALKPQQNANTFMGATASWMNQSAPQNKEAGVAAIQMDPNQTKDQTVTSLDFGDSGEDDQIAVDNKKERNWNIDGEASVNAFNAAANAGLGFIDRMNQAKQEKQMLENEFNSDNLYSSSNDKFRGDYAQLGQKSGLMRYDQMGQDTYGAFAYGQSGGYMQSGGFTEGDEIDMTEEELQDFLANGGEVEYL